MRASCSWNEEVEMMNETAAKNIESAVEIGKEGSKEQEKEKTKTAVDEKVVKEASGKGLKTKEVAGPANHGTAVMEAAGANERSRGRKQQSYILKE
ncbi:hypothetical protein OYC64_018598 [Pagothenia borchgrevinki]|uniref:Uncharacterized protein n=1 Tax=Pagothenia borchgrevinki TaxID=8213 RepID=A0ABD2GP44_PAGBO